MGVVESWGPGEVFRAVWYYGFVSFAERGPVCLERSGVLRRVANLYGREPIKCITFVGGKVLSPTWNAREVMQSMRDSEQKRSACSLHELVPT